MSNDPFNLALNPRYKQLETIDGIKFTHREVDLIACMLSGRGRKSTASLLSISEKTVETHTRNIMRKLECNSQESIRNRIEKSNKITHFKDHYLHLLTESFFSQYLQKIFFLRKNAPSTCLLICEQEQDFILPFTVQLEKHLKLTGITTFLKGLESNNEDFNWAKKEEAKNATYVIYFISESTFLLLNNKKLPLNNIRAMWDLANKEKIIIVRLQGQEKARGFLIGDTKVPCFTLSSEENYYFLFFKILKIFFVDRELNKIIEEFKEEYAVRFGEAEKDFDNQKPLTQEQSAQSNYFPTEAKQNSNKFKHKDFKNSPWNNTNFLSIFLQLGRKWWLASGAFCLIICSAFLIIFYSNIGDYLNRHRESLASYPVRSDLVIPTKSVFLDRSHLISQIDNKLKDQMGIRTIALVGIGGAGKTILARQYARQQKANFVWEINSETPENLKDSFESLAQALSKTEEDKKALKKTLDSKNAVKREEEVLFFVKNRLRAYDNWFLIFDNMEKFSDIQKYLPKDDETWGQGKIILTTRDGNIQNNKHINEVILVGALDESQKLALFNKIMSASTSSNHTLSQDEQTKEFLKEIPSFPLDISLAAYYIKATQIPYNTYLESLKQYDKDFAMIQENLLKESGEYTKTRYNIIALSLEHLLKAHQDFGDLLLFISLVDSQEIPRELLSDYKGENIVGSFIYNLEKYSLATINLSPSPLLNSTLSIHRTMQGIIFNYLINTLKPARRNTAPKEISEALASSINSAIEKEDMRRMKLLARHGGVFLKHAHLLNEDSKGPLGTEIGRTYFYLGDYKKAEEFFRVSLPYIQKHENENKLKTAKISDTLGVIYRELGDYQEAEKVLEKSLSIYEKYDPQNYREIAHTLTHLGSIHKELGNDNKAKSLLERSLPLYEKCPPKNEKDSLWTLVHLGMVYRDLGDYERAINVFKNSLHIYKTHFPENYVRRASVLTSLGNVYNLAEDHLKAKEILEESLAIYKKHFSEYDRGYASTAVYLGETLKALGEYQQAHQLFTKSLKIYEKYYGRDHVEVARILRKLGNLYSWKGQPEAAESSLNEALKIFQKTNHPESNLVLKELSKIQLKKL